MKCYVFEIGVCLFLPSVGDPEAVGWVSGALNGAGDGQRIGRWDTNEVVLDTPATAELDSQFVLHGGTRNHTCIDEGSAIVL